ncbi:cysteine desulfurase [Candidatus Woesearchaeota archaeon]|nr:cysteine desulfurase [Candidatus Woesearchaeota archaeon]
MAAIDVRKDFPILKRKVHEKKLIYLDSAATSQKPIQVINTITDFYKNYNTNIHRALHTLSDEATTLYETARKKIASFINANPEEIIFTKNATEGLNLLAFTFGKDRVKENDIILVTEMEHHSNLVPWQQLAKQQKAKLSFIPVTAEGKLDLETAENLLKQKPKLFAFTHVSNVLGTINPAKQLIELAKKYNVPTILDASQSVPHMPVDVRDLDCDFLVFSGHKMLGPTGIGVLYGKKQHLQNMNPFLTGGDMIKEVSYTETSWNDLPWKFEAGTPPIAEVIGLGAAVDYLQKIGMKSIQDHEQELTAYALEQLQKIKQVKIYGSQQEQIGVIAFNLADIHAHDLATVVDEEGIAIRSGHHCAQPLVEKLGVPATARMSFYIYTTKKDIDKAIKAIKKAKKVFKL